MHFRGAKLAALMATHDAKAKQTFGGTYFTLNGNLVMGSHGKTGLIVRLGPHAVSQMMAMGVIQ